MNEEWARHQWAGVDLGDTRLNMRSIKIGTACAKRPTASTPQRFDSWAELKAAYRFMDNPRVTYEAIQEPHRRNVLEAARGSNDPVLFIQDGSEVLYNGHTSTPDLGPTADSGGNGMLLHSCLVAQMEKGDRPRVLGIAHQKYWVRREQETGNDDRQKESDVWLETVKAIGSPPPSCCWVTVADRGGDIYDFLYGMKEMGWNYVVRAKHNRHIQVNGKAERLHPWVRALTAKKSIPTYFRTRGEQFSGEVELELTWGKATIQSSLTTSCQTSMEVTFVRVFAQENSKKIEWILSTSLPVENADDALKVVVMYQKRWLIEEYHKALKTGCRVEECQMKRCHRLEVMLGFMSVVATSLLSLKELCRFSPDAPAKRSVPLALLKIIGGYFRVDWKSLTLEAFWRLVARLGGFIGRRSDKNPGWQTTWLGFSRLHDMWLGVSCLRSCG